MPSASKFPGSSREKPTAKSAATHKTTNKIKSAEIIQDSDDEDEGEDFRTPPKQNKASIAANSTPKPPSIVKLKAPSSSAKPALVISNGASTQKRKLYSPRALNREETESQSEGEEEEKHGESGAEDERDKKGKRVEDDEVSSEPSHTGSDSESGSGSVSRSESESEGGDGGNSGGDNIPQAKHKTPTKAPKETASTKPVPPYDPPPGFESATITLPASSNLPNLLSPNSLRNKQFWHIIVPSSVPITSLTEVSSQSVQNGAVILSHKGTDYGMVSKTQSSSAKRVLLLPAAEINEYKSVTLEIAETLRLQQIIPNRAHESGFVSSDATNATSRYGSAARQQPDGLRMRYRPFGDSEDSSEKSGSSPEKHEQAPRFLLPPGIETQPSKRKRTPDMVDVHLESPAKKQKSRAHAESVVAAGVSGTKVRKDRVASPVISKKKLDHPGSERNDVQTPVKRHKSKAPTDSANGTRTTQIDSNPDQLGRLESPMKQKQLTKAQQNGLVTASHSQKHNKASKSLAEAESSPSKSKLDLPAKNPQPQNPTTEPTSATRSPQNTTKPLAPPSSKNSKPDKQRKKHSHSHPPRDPLPPAEPPQPNGKRPHDAAPRRKTEERARKGSSPGSETAASTGEAAERKARRKAETRARQRAERERRGEEGGR